jgi:hypothetical protein
MATTVELVQATLLVSLILVTYFGIGERRYHLRWLEGHAKPGVRPPFISLIGMAQIAIAMGLILMVVFQDKLGDQLGVNPDFLSAEVFTMFMIGIGLAMFFMFIAWELLGLKNWCRLLYMGTHMIFVMVYLVKLLIIRYEGVDGVADYIWVDVARPYLQTLVLMLISLLIVYYLRRPYIKDAFTIKEEKGEKVTTGYMTKAKYDVSKGDDKGWKDVISAHGGKNVDEIGVADETMFQCPVCETMVPDAADTCPNCGATFIKEEKEEEPIPEPKEEMTRTGRKKKISSFVGSGGVVGHTEKEDDVREIAFVPEEKKVEDPKPKYTPKAPPPKPASKQKVQLEWVECPFCLAFVEYRSDSCPKCGELWEGEALTVKLKCPKCETLLDEKTPSCTCGFKFEQ